MNPPPRSPGRIVKAEETATTTAEWKRIAQEWKYWYRFHKGQSMQQAETSTELRERLNRVGVIARGEDTGS